MAFVTRASRIFLAFALIFTFIGAGNGASAQRGIQLLRDAETEAFLRDISEPIFEAAGRESGAIDLYLVNSTSLNAFVAGGQRIFIHSGLIAAAETPNELIGVIAHETGHITGSHLARSQEEMSGLMKPMILGMALGIGAMISGAPEAGQAILLGSQHIANRQVLSYSRAHESAADQAGAGFLEASGQSGKGMLAFFDRFRDRALTSVRAPDPYTQSHPMSDKRIVALRSRMEASPYFDTKDSPELQVRLDLIRAKIHGFLDRADVVLRRFPVSDHSEPARYARSVLYFRRGQISSAVEEIDLLIATDPTYPYFHELKGQILFESGHVVEAIAPYKKANALHPNDPLLLASYGQALIAAAEKENEPAGFDKAIKELTRALQVDADLPMAWQYMAQAYSSKGDIGMAELSTAEYYFYAGSVDEAARFATRAKSKLDEGTVSFNRANDLIFLARASAPGGHMGRN